MRAVLLALLFVVASAVSERVEAQVLPVSCANKAGKPIDCPPPDDRPPAFGDAAINAYLRDKRDQIKISYDLVIDLRNHRFRFMRLPRHAYGYCTAWYHDEAGDYASSNPDMYVHVQMDAAQCAEEAKKVIALKKTFAFDAYPDRLRCDSENAAACAEAAIKLQALAQKDLADDSTVVFGDMPKVPPERLVRPEVIRELQGIRAANAKMVRDILGQSPLMYFVNGTRNDLRCVATYPLGGLQFGEKGSVAVCGAPWNEKIFVFGGWVY